MWGNLGFLLQRAAEGEWGGSDPRDLCFVLFVCLVLPAFFSGPVLLAVAGKRASASWLKLPPLVLLWAASVLPPFCFALIHLRERGGSDAVIQAGAAVMMAYLFVCGMTALMAWSARGKPGWFFWLGLVPLSEALVAWLACVVYLLLFSRSSVKEPLFVAISVCAVGSLMMLLGWLGWWAAVRRAVAPQSREQGPVKSSVDPE